MPDRENHRASLNGSVRVGPLLGIPTVVRELGHDPESILADADLSPAEFSDPDNEIPYLIADRLLSRCVAVTQCEHFGLLVGERAGPSSLGVAGFLLQHAPDVGTALRDLVHHLDLHDSGGIPMLIIRNDITMLGYAIHQAGTQATDQIYDLSIAVACNIMRGLCGENWNPVEVLLSHRPPQELAPYGRFFRAPLRFDAEQSAIAFPTWWLNRKVAAADALLHQHLEKEASELRSHRETDIVSDLRKLLLKSLLNRTCSIDNIARQLCIHERTLHRRLREQGTGFRQELEQVRHELARQLLAETAIPVKKIATSLGYTDASAFITSAAVVSPGFRVTVSFFALLSAVAERK